MIINYNEKETAALYAIAEKELSAMLEENGLYEDELWNEYLSEIDEDGFSVHTSCDEIWCMLDYVAANCKAYPIDVTYNGNTIRMMYDSTNKHMHMLFVTMLWCFWELGNEIKLNGEDIHEINKKIDF